MDDSAPTLYDLSCPPGAGGNGGGGGSGGGPKAESLGCSSCGGMPVWQVREAQVDYRLFDTPLKYTPAHGPAVSLDLVYQTWRPTDFDYYPTNDVNPLFGPQWNCVWNSDLVVDSKVYWNYLGGRVIYDFNTYPLLSDPAYQDGSRVEVFTNGSSVVIGGRVYRSDGHVLEYFQASSATQFLLTSLFDPDGKALTFTYDAHGRLDEITAATGETTSFVYGDLDGDSDPSNNRVVTQVNAPASRTANFAYEYHEGYSSTNWYLTNITDTVGISSGFYYDYDIVGVGFDYYDYSPLETLTTAYGTTRFEYLEYPTNYFGLTLLITEPNGGQHLYLQGDRAGTPDVPASFDSAVIPTGLPLGTLDTTRQGRNTFYWGPLQLTGIGNLDVHNWTWDQFKRARIRHWLGHYDAWDSGHTHISDTLAWEQSPSPDGTVEGLVTWYDYVGKDPGRLDLIGTNTEMPAVIAHVLPNGTTWYQYFEHNSLGKPTKQVETYTKTDGTIGLRTNTFTYAANGIDLTKQLGPNNEQVVSNYFGNSYHQVDVSYDALGQETRYTYNGNRNLTSVKTPGGLTTTNLYFSSGGSVDRLERTIDLEIKRTNSFSYLNDLVDSHTDERGLTVTNYWDGLQRLVGMKYPDGTTTSNRYTALDITASKDRLGYWAYASYNGIRQKIAETNANNIATRYGYCDCGALLSVTNAWNTSGQLVTAFGYDFQGNRRYTYHPDGTVTNWFDSLQRVIITGDAWAYRWLNYNNQGLLTSVTNAFGAAQLTTYDIEDRPVYVTDANNVTITNTYDDLGRLRTRTAPDGGAEKFGYSGRGMIAYTNQLSFTNFYVYDEAGRKTFETNANWELIRYTNNAAGDLLALVDGKNQVTIWNYDEYGRVTNKLDQVGAEILRYTYDADSRLASRWSIAKGTTYYTNDAVGNLTQINYPASTDVTFAYDPLNRVTSMVDAAGTTSYSFAAGGQLWTEDGPWASDTVTNIYYNRMRTDLALLQPTGKWTNNFGYDAAKRLTSVISPAGTFSYTLGAASAASPLVKKLLLPNTSYITNTYDAVARWKGTYLKTSGHVLTNKHEYNYNAAHQRTQQTFMDSATYEYTYDPIGQLKVADSSVAAQDRGYTYDSAWNLNYRTNNGTLQTFKVDGLNQLTNSPNPASTNTYDGNGNLITAKASSTVNYTYCYDDENRLVSWMFVKSPTACGGTSGNNNDLRTDFLYDGQGRLRVRVEYDGTKSSGWVTNTVVRYVYDGRRVIQERDGSNVPTVSYTRGTDLSGSLEGAGGIGGLLGRSHAYQTASGNWTNHNFYHADGNGNVTYLLNSSQSKVAEYRYDPFGNTISSSGTLAAANVYRFSSKEIHLNSGMYYYGYRFYHPNLQRWPNSDPLGEPGFEVLRHNRSSILAGGPNRYLFVKNNPINGTDYLGLMDSITLGFLACVRSGNSPAFCACVAAPDPEECERQYGACINAIGKIPNPKTGKIEKPSPADICKCACSLMYQDEKDKSKKDDCNKVCDKKIPKCP